MILLSAGFILECEWDKICQPIHWKLAIVKQTFGDEDIEYITGIT